TGQPGSSSPASWADLAGPRPENAEEVGDTRNPPRHMFRVFLESTTPTAHKPWSGPAEELRRAGDNGNTPRTALVTMKRVRRAAAAPGPKFSRCERPRAVRRSRSGALVLSSSG